MSMATASIIAPGPCSSIRGIRREPSDSFTHTRGMTISPSSTDTKRLYAKATARFPVFALLIIVLIFDEQLWMGLVHFVKIYSDLMSHLIETVPVGCLG